MKIHSKLTISSHCLKTKTVLAAILCAALAISIAGCQKADSTATTAPKATEKTAVTEQAAAPESETVMTETASTSESLKSLPSEKDKYPELEQLLIDYFQIPAEDQSNTQYMYDNIDLNNDGTDELMVYVIGSYTSGTGGDTALYVAKNGEKLEVKQKFTIFNQPVIISDHLTNGFKDIIVPDPQNTASSFVTLTYTDGTYSDINSAPSMSSLDGVTGTRIFDNDVQQDREDGAALYLGDGAPSVVSPDGTSVSITIGDYTGDATLTMEDTALTINSSDSALPVKSIPYAGSTWKKEAGENSYILTIVSDGKTIKISGVTSDFLDLLSMYVKF